VEGDGKRGERKRKAAVEENGSGIGEGQSRDRNWDKEREMERERERGENGQECRLGINFVDESFGIEVVGKRLEKERKGKRVKLPDDEVRNNQCRHKSQ